MKAHLSIRSGKRLPDQPKPDHGMLVAWAELDGIVITDVLASHTNRDVVEQNARIELAQRLRRALSDDEQKD